MLIEYLERCVRWVSNARPKRIALALSLLIAPTLSGCLFPDDFDVEVSLSADGSYSYKFDGNVYAYEFLPESGKALHQNAESMRQGFMNSVMSEGQKTLGGRGYKNVRFQQVGDAKLKVAAEKAGKVSTAARIENIPVREMPLYTIQRQTLQGMDLVFLREEELSKNTARDVGLRRLKGVGRLKVNIGDGEVVDTNRKKSLFGNSYTWDVVLTDQSRPFIVMKAK